MTEKSRRLETANFERAEAAVRMENDENTADVSGRRSDQVRAGASDRALAAADRKIKKIETEP
jgi:hypothetical protein